MKKDKKVVGLFFSGIILLVLIISISFYKSWFLVLGDIILFIVSLISIYKYDLKK